MEERQKRKRWWERDDQYCIVVITQIYVNNSSDAICFSVPTVRMSGCVCVWYEQSVSVSLLLSLYIRLNKKHFVFLFYLFIIWINDGTNTEIQRDTDTHTRALANETDEKLKNENGKERTKSADTSVDKRKTHLLKCILCRSYYNHIHMRFVSRVHIDRHDIHRTFGMRSDGIWNENIIFCCGIYLPTTAQQISQRKDNHIHWDWKLERQRRIRLCSPCLGW